MQSRWLPSFSLTHIFRKGGGGWGHFVSLHELVNNIEQGPKFGYNHTGKARFTGRKKKGGVGAPLGRGPSKRNCVFLLASGSCQKPLQMVIPRGEEADGLGNEPLEGANEFVSQPNTGINRRRS